MGFLDKFRKPKWEHKDPNKRIEGIKELTDGNILASIANNEMYRNDVRIAALKNPHIDRHHHLTIGKWEDKNREIKKAAIECLNDDDLEYMANKMPIRASRSLVNDKRLIDAKHLAEMELRKRLKNQ